MTGAAPMVPCGRIGYMIVGASQNSVIAVGDVLEAQLVASGWTRVTSQLTADGMSAGTHMQRGQWEFDVRARLAEVATGIRSPEQWQAACRLAGIEAVQIALPTLQSAGAQYKSASPGTATPAPPSAGSDISAVSFLRWLAIVIFVVAIPLAIRSGLPGSDAMTGPKEVADATYLTADGSSNLAGDYVTASYTRTGHDWEYTRPPTNKDGENDGASWWVGQYVPGATLHFGIDHRIWVPAIVNDQERDNFLAAVTAKSEEAASGAVKQGTLTIGGRSAHYWEFDTIAGKRVRDMWVLGPVHSFMFECINDRPTAASLAVSDASCNAILSSVKFHVSD